MPQGVFQVKRLASNGVGGRWYSANTLILAYDRPNRSFSRKAKVSGWLTIFAEPGL